MFLIHKRAPLSCFLFLAVRYFPVVTMITLGLCRHGQGSFIQLPRKVSRVKCQVSLREVMAFNPENHKNQ